MKFSYSREYVPPAPVLEIRLALPGEPFAAGPLAALVDSGADASVVPLGHIQSLGAQIDDRKYLRGAWGEPRVVYTYLLDVEVAGLRLPSIEIVGDDLGKETIIGRDVLNRLRITLDGPSEALEVRG